MSQDTLDLRQSTSYDMMINKNRTLKASIACVYYTGTTTQTEVDFSFAGYTGATLNVKRNSNSSQTILDFDTDDGSIILSIGNTFQLIKTAAELQVLLTGEFKYDMYLKSASYPKRAFLSGKFIIIDTITP
jgi:hypothetical protein